MNVEPVMLKPSTVLFDDIRMPALEPAKVLSAMVTSVTGVLGPVLISTPRFALASSFTRVMVVSVLVTGN